MPRRSAYRPSLESIESRLAPSTAQLSTAAILPYIEQENIYKQTQFAKPATEPTAIYMQYDGLKGA